MPWHFVTPKVCGSFWHYVGRIFMNLPYNSVFISLRKVCLRVIFILWEADVSSRDSRGGYCKYSLTNEEKLKGKDCGNDLWFVNVQVHSASSHSKSIMIVSKFKMLFYFWILTCFPVCNGYAGERVITYFSSLLKGLSKSGVFEHIPPQLVLAVKQLKCIAEKLFAFLFHSGESHGRYCGSTRL